MKKKQFIPAISLIVFAACKAPSIEAQMPSQVPWHVLDRLGGGLGDQYIGSAIYSQFMGTPSSLQTVYRRRLERASATSSWFRWDQEYALSFWATAYSARNGGDDFFIAGIKSNGETIVEHWRFSQPGYHYTVDYVGNPPALGVPAGTFFPVIRTGNGGNWKWTKKNFGQSSGSGEIPAPGFTPAKTVLFEGALGPITAMGADPEGRFLLIYDSGAKAIKRLLLTDPAQGFTLLYDLSANSNLVYIDGIKPRDFGVPGERTYLLSGAFLDPTEGEKRGLGTLKDANNDGIFEEMIYLDEQAFKATPYGVWADWIVFTRVP